jgi:hypothetical protein
VPGFSLAPSPASIGLYDYAEERFVANVGGSRGEAVCFAGSFFGANDR